jgi:hypothetical protein
MRTIKMLAVIEGNSMSQPIVYDKAKYHYETIEQSGLVEIHAYIHTGLYLGWLIDNDLIDEEFKEDFGDDIPKFLNRELTAPELFSLWDGALVDDMLNEEGNKFSQYYFDFEKGQYLEDYMRIAAKGLPSEFHVKNTWENYEVVKNFVTKRFEEWKNPSPKNSAKPKKWWKFWS